MIISINKILLIIFLFLSITQVVGQITNGIIVYERKTNLFKKYTKKEMREWLRGKKTKIDVFELYFNNTMSLFKPQENDVHERMDWVTNKNSVFQHLEKKQRLSIYDKWGDTFYVEDTLKSRVWKITERKRDISGYECRRAIWEKNDSTKIYAWYTDEIIPSTGPESFNGLPGIILGLATEDGGVVYFAKSITEKYVDIKKLIPTPKKKDLYTEQELRLYLEKISKGDNWKKLAIDDMFYW